MGEVAGLGRKLRGPKERRLYCAASEGLDERRYRTDAPNSTRGLHAECAATLLRLHCGQSGIVLLFLAYGTDVRVIWRSLNACRPVSWTRKINGLTHRTTEIRGIFGPGLGSNWLKRDGTGPHWDGTGPQRDGIGLEWAETGRGGRWPAYRPASVGHLLARTGLANIEAKTWAALPGCFTALAWSWLAGVPTTTMPTMPMP